MAYCLKKKKKVEFEGIKRIVEMEKEKPREQNDFVSSEEEWFLGIYEE